MRAERREEAITQLRAGRCLRPDLAFELAEYLADQRAADFASRKARRDCLIIEAVKKSRYRSDLGKATWLRARLASYAGSAWAREKELPSCPRRHEGEIEAYCWEILKLVDKVLSITQIREILRG